MNKIRRLLFWLIWNMPLGNLVPYIPEKEVADERYTLKEALSIKPLKSNLRERNWRMIWIRFKALPDSIVYVLKTGIILSEKQRRQ